MHRFANACSLALSSDGSKLLCGITKAVQMWDVATGKMLYTVKSDVTYPVPRFTADGNRFAVPDSPDAICFRESATGRELGRMRDAGNSQVGQPVLVTLRTRCMHCHGKQVATVITFGSVQDPKSLPPVTRLRPSDNDCARDVARLKMESADFKALRRQWAVE